MQLEGVFLDTQMLQVWPTELLSVHAQLFPKREITPQDWRPTSIARAWVRLWSKWKLLQVTPMLKEIDARATIAVKAAMDGYARNPCASIASRGPDVICHVHASHECAGALRAGTEVGLREWGRQEEKRCGRGVRILSFKHTRKIGVMETNERTCLEDPEQRHVVLTAEWRKLMHLRGTGLDTNACQAGSSRQTLRGAE